MFLYVIICDGMWRYATTCDDVTMWRSDAATRSGLKFAQSVASRVFSKRVALDLFGGATVHLIFWLRGNSGGELPAGSTTRVTEEALQRWTPCSFLRRATEEALHRFLSNLWRHVAICDDLSGHVMTCDDMWRHAMLCDYGRGDDMWLCDDVTMRRCGDVAAVIVMFGLLLC